MVQLLLLHAFYDTCFQRYHLHTRFGSLSYDSSAVLTLHIVIFDSSSSDRALLAWFYLQLANPKSLFPWIALACPPRLILVLSCFAGNTKSGGRHDGISADIGRMMRVRDRAMADALKCVEWWWSRNLCIIYRCTRLSIRDGFSPTLSFS